MRALLSKINELFSFRSGSTGADREQWRLLKDKLARWGVAVGGIGVIVAIVLIFFYLLYVVVPLFKGASVEQVGSYALPGDGNTMYLSMEEQAQIGVRVTHTGQVTFFSTADGQLIKQVQLHYSPRARITAFAKGQPGKGILALGLSNGRALVFRPVFRTSYVDGKRIITPDIEYPLENKTVLVDSSGGVLNSLAVQVSEDKATLVAGTKDSRLILQLFTKEESFLEENVTWQATRIALPDPEDTLTRLLLDPDQRRLFTADRQGHLTYFDLRNPLEPRLIQRLQLSPNGSDLTSLEFLSGGFSLLAGFADGQLAQWFPVRDNFNNELITHVRSFKPLKGPISAIAPEFFRKGFVAADENGNIALYHTTAHRLLHKEHINELPLALAMAPRANALLMETRDGDLVFWRLHNEHPEISWSSLWGKVWYEGYAEPQWMWQSSASTNEFEPKFSLTPLSFGTLKAAFYAMLLAAPLAIFGAVFTAYFMAPAMRQTVKPTIEVMEALPTVILGFLAGLWLAPFIESHLPGTFSLLVIMPLAIILFAYGWQHMPARFRLAIPDGWQAALLVPVVVLVGWAALALSPGMERWLFGGDMRIWLTKEMGVDFDQRNAIIVGLAMGFAVIPTIYSIAEDAIFSVPRHLSYGSLALGATPWQTLMRVVLPTASPGIFSGLMIGMGRAVGETMIVLMATGNTPVMDFSVFQGMRTLSANIAVEMPESEVGSTHYRVLFLAALVLFLFTFIFNTLAEIIRQRLRNKYSSL